MANKIYDKIKKYIKDNYKFIITMVIILVVFTYKLPYCIYSPGGKVDLSERIEIENGYKSKGDISMTYVSMVRPSIPFILMSYIMPDWDLQKDSEVAYENFTMDETIEIDKVYMQEGINNAIISAYKLVGKEVKIIDQKLKVIYVDKNSNSNLKINDEIISIDNNTVKNIEEIKEIIKDKSLDDKIEVKIKRNNKNKTITSKLMILDNELKLGISTISLVELETDPKINIKTKDSESGSSGGFMTALAIYNALTKEDITKGNSIVGTGTIDDAGNIGEIDGVKYKLLGAAKKNADVFLCPEENYKEAIKVKKEHKLKIDIVKVKTLQEAVNYLESR